MNINKSLKKQSIQTTLTLPVPLYLKLTTTAENKGLSNSAVVRKALNKYFLQEKRIIVEQGVRHETANP